jgi:tape measure domain-containing protein
MALNLGTITAAIQLQTGNFISSLNNITNLMRNAFGSQTQSNVNGTANAVNNLNSHLKNVERVVGGIMLSQTFYRATNDIQKGSEALFQFMNNLEKSKVAMQYFLGNKQKANGFIMSMEDFAANTPFSTEQALSLSQRLMAAQFAPEKVKSVMSILNDAASVGGTTAEQLDRIVLAITQMRTNGKIAGQELRQLAEANIPIYKILEEQLGLTSKQMMNIGKMHISGDVGVEALLKGLQERYKGAADQISMTIPGMMETIKDDLKMVGADLFTVPYKSFEGFIRNIRNGLENLRNIAFKSGTGGVFQAMFSPQTLQGLRYLAGSIRSLIQSASYLVTAMKPVVDIIGNWLVQVLDFALVPLAALTRLFVDFTVTIMNTVPVVKYLFAAILSLSIGYTVAKVMMVLWRVTGLGLICTTVAKSVTTLASALKILAVAVIENPIVAFFIVLAGAAVYAASKMSVFKKTGDDISGLFAKIAGYDPTKIFKPNIDDANTSMDQFNQSVVDSNTNLSDTGSQLQNVADKTKKAKKAADDFLQSFDEIHNIDPSKSTALDAAAAMPDLNANMPDLGSLTSVPDLAGIVGPDNFKLPSGTDLFPTADDLWKGLKKIFKDGWNDLKNWWDGIDWLDVIFGYKDFVRRNIELGKEFKELGKNIGDWVFARSKDFNKWYDNTSKAVSEWNTKMSKEITDWASKTGKAIGDWASGVLTSIGDWAVNTNKAFGDWVVGNSKRFNDWVNGIVKDISDWNTNTTNAINGWVSNTSKVIGDWISGRANDFGNWVTNVGKSIGDWASGRINDFNNWASNTGGTIVNWVQTQGSNLGNWASGAGRAIGDWAGNAMRSIADWYNNTSGNIGNWVNNQYNNLANFANNAGNAIFNGFNWLGGSINNIFSNLWSAGIKPGLNSAIYGVNSFLEFLNGLKISFPAVHVPGFNSDASSFHFFHIPDIPYLETGGIVKKQHLVMAGEKGRKEAVVPLDNPNYMKPFSDAVANQLMKSGAFGGGGGGNQQQQVLYVGTLIADDRSLKELKRRMNVVSLKENQRGVPTV